MRINVHHGDCRAVLKKNKKLLYDGVATDPPYHLSSIVKRFGGPNAAAAKIGKTGAYARASRGFMNQKWDGGDVAFKRQTWRAVYNRLKPGAYLVAFSSTRTYHRMACAIEDAGFIVHDMIAWTYGSGFPKSHNIGRQIRQLWPLDRNLSRAEYQELRRMIRSCARDHEDHGTALKPAFEPIILAQKPISEKSIGRNVLKWGTGALNIGDCRIQTEEQLRGGAGRLWSHYRDGVTDFTMPAGPRGGDARGRWPTNMAHDGHADVLSLFPESLGQKGDVTPDTDSAKFGRIFGRMERNHSFTMRGDTGSAARFHYSAKAGPLDRLGSEHPTVKPVDLMRWLLRLIMPAGGRVLDPFAGSGTTGIAAKAEGLSADLIDFEESAVQDIRRKLAMIDGDGELKMVALNRGKRPKGSAPLFGDHE